jgi:predicted Rossmann fold flavoprotein
VNTLIIGGGAAGIFAAQQIKALAPDARVVVLEKQAQLLSKVKVSGGGRCNVTHACWTPKELVQYYPRGRKELLGPFHKFMTGDMMHWLSERNVPTKIEEDGRVFPESDNSQTVIDCFLAEADRLGVEIYVKEALKQISTSEDGFDVQSSKNAYRAKNILWATGSTPSSLKLLEEFGIELTERVPSLFAFDIPLQWLHGLAGVSLLQVRVTLPITGMETHGPLLITHKGLSGPGILKLSSWAADELAAAEYQFRILLNWVDAEMDEIQAVIKKARAEQGAKKVLATPLFSLPKRLWKALLIAAGIRDENWADLTKVHLSDLRETLGAHDLPVKGKSTHKAEFVTAGGVENKFIDFTRMEHRQVPGLFFAGEVLNIDALTGGFNFQAAWTTAWIAAHAIAEKSVVTQP